MRIFKHLNLFWSAGSKLGSGGFRQGVIAIAVLAEIALFVMMVVTGADVTLRAFDRPIPGAYEITQFMMATCIGIGLAYCAIHKRHVKVDVVYRHFSKRGQAILDTVTGILALGLFSLFTWQTFLFMNFERSNRITSPVLSIPTSPFIGIVGVGFGVITLIILVDLVNSIVNVVRK